MNGPSSWNGQEDAVPVGEGAGFGNRRRGDDMPDDAQATTTTVPGGGGGAAWSGTITVSEPAFRTFVARMEPIPGSLRSDRALRAVAPDAGGTPEGEVLDGRTSPGGDITRACIAVVEDLRGDITALLSDLGAARAAYRQGQGGIELGAQQLLDTCAAGPGEGAAPPVR